MRSDISTQNVRNRVGSNQVMRTMIRHDDTVNTECRGSGSILCGENSLDLRIHSRNKDEVHMSDNGAEASNSPYGCALPRCHEIHVLAVSAGVTCVMACVRLPLHLDFLYIPC